jgi:hypothetical protein
LADDVIDVELILIFGGPTGGSNVVLLQITWMLMTFYHFFSLLGSSLVINNIKNRALSELVSSVFFLNKTITNKKYRL